MPDDVKELEETVKERLDDFFAGEEDETTPEEDVQLESEKEEDNEKVEEEKEPEADEEDKESEKEPEEKPALPENYFRAAIHQGMEPDNIQKIFEADPEGALALFENIYKSTNFISEQTSALGRTKRAETQKALEAENQPEKIEYKGVDIDKFKNEYGEDSPAVVAMVEALNDQNKQLFEMVQKQQPESRPQQQQPTDEDKKIWDTINTFFSDEKMEVFGDFYGKAEKGQQWNSALTGEQSQNRLKVVDEADLIIGGAALQGRNMNYDEALSRAHLVLSSKLQEQVARTKIQSEIKRRSKGITVKNTGKSSDKPITPEQQEKALENKVGGKLKKIFKR